MSKELQNDIIKEPAVAYNGENIIYDFSLLDTSKRYAYADYLKWHFKERVELIKGRIFNMSPAPTATHQLILGDLHVNFANYLKGKPCKVFLAPFDVRFPKNSTDKNPYSVVQPDLCVICDTNKIDERGCNGAPDLIVEILSPSTASKDINNKFNLYQEHEVKEYWIIDPSNKILDVFMLNKGEYQVIQKFDEEALVTVGIFPDLIVDLKDVFAE